MINSNDNSLVTQFTVRTASVCLIQTDSPPGLLSGVDLVEVNPFRGQTEQEVQSTASTAVNVLFSCFGRLRGGNHPPDYRLVEPFDKLTSEVE